MAIILEASYSKKLGLPHFSSHSYVVSIRTELTDVAQVPEESSRLYRLLQDTVDHDIQQVGFIPMPPATACLIRKAATETSAKMAMAMGSGMTVTGTIMATPMHHPLTALGAMATRMAEAIGPALPLVPSSST